MVVHSEVSPAPSILEREVALFIAAEHPDPHRFLGLHDDGIGGKIIRLWRPGAPHLYVEIQGTLVSAAMLHPAGLFGIQVPVTVSSNEYRVYHPDGQLRHDPYSFSPTFGEMDEYLFGRGVHYDIYRVMGARPMQHLGCWGTAFTVWAPTAQRVSIVSDFNHWDGRVHPMRRLGVSGVWELFVPEIGEGSVYKFEIKTAESEIKIKADPYAKFSQLRPQTASIVWDIDRYNWNDGEWMARRKDNSGRPCPLAIYEVHLGSWKKRHGGWLNYGELAQELADYCKQMGFTHVELMPIAEHPLDESWGYQVTGYYAVTSRYGSPRDFQYLVDCLHCNGIGVILDWVPAHFPTDEFSLVCFDGTCLYEHADDRLGHHPHWDTKIFNYGRHEVCNFLIGSALYWFDKLHIDGLRVDAVASMLYLDYGRRGGDWIPNRYGGNENLEAIEFLKHLNSVAHQHHPGILMVAEESTSFQGVTHNLEVGGLGFDLKWNMGWMNDTLRYFSKDPIYRCHHHHDLTFGLLYAFSERFALVLSHDEVVHGKKSLLSKMPGDLWQRFANLRLLYSYMMCQPGKKLLFMSGEFAQWDEWDCKQQIQWQLLEFPYHRGVHDMVRELNLYYQRSPALWEHDFDGLGFEWVDFSDHCNSVISYWRRSCNLRILCVHNFTPQYHDQYMIRTGPIYQVREVFNSDATQWGGSGQTNPQPAIEYTSSGGPIGLRIHCAPLATMIFEVDA